MDKYTVSALKQIAKEKGFKGYSKLKKAELVKLLAKHAKIEKLKKTSCKYETMDWKVFFEDRELMFPEQTVEHYGEAFSYPQDDDCHIEAFPNFKSLLDKIGMEWTYDLNSVNRRLIDLQRQTIFPFEMVVVIYDDTNEGRTDKVEPMKSIIFLSDKTSDYDFASYEFHELRGDSRFLQKAQVDNNLTTKNILFIRAEYADF